MDEPGTIDPAALNAPGKLLVPSPRRLLCAVAVAGTRRHAGDSARPLHQGPTAYLIIELWLTEHFWSLHSIHYRSQSSIAAEPARHQAQSIV